jgi:hypothetical protein
MIGGTACSGTWLIAETAGTAGANFSVANPSATVNPFP